MAGSSTSRSSVDRDTLVAYLDDYLEARQGSDYCPNGLQVEGRPRISRMVTGVSACLELFQAAEALGADGVLVHHGLFWRGDPRVLTGVQYRRLAVLIRSEINLFAYHLPLDRHLEVGNNAVAARLLRLEAVEPFCEHDGQSIGVRGRFASAAPELDTVLGQLAEVYGQPPLSFPYGPRSIRTVALVSGGGGKCLQQAIDRQIDLFITGEAEEWTMNLAREAGINVVANGHYATERLGVRALGEQLASRFGIDVDFVDIPNPV